MREGDAREEKLRALVMRISARQGVSPEFSVLNVEDSVFLLQRLDEARTEVKRLLNISKPLVAAVEEAASKARSW